MCSFTMDILNKEEGPNIFWGICVFCVIVNIILFAQSGMIDLDYLINRELRSHPDDEAFESSVAKMKQTLDKRDTLAHGSQLLDRKTFDISS